MTLNSLNHLFTDPSVPARSNGHSLTSAQVKSPTEIQQLQVNKTAVTQLPDSAKRMGYSPVTESDHSFNSSFLSAPDIPSSEVASSPWSAAVGRASIGKSGRVIEKLQGDNDRLQREKKLAIVKLEEEVRRGESARAGFESLQVSNENLLSMHESDKNFLNKKDRRIEELRADLEMERSKREKAEKATHESRRERDEMVEKLRREVAEDRELSKRSISQYETLSKSWKGLETRYERQMLKLRDDLETLRTEIEGDKRKLSYMELIMDQLRQEGDKTRDAKASLSLKFEQYKAEQEAGIRDMREEAERNNDNHQRVLKQMEDMLGRMRYIVNVKKDLRLAD